ncbi:ABCB1, partial [Symbiodinium pilosum]
MCIVFGDLIDGMGAGASLPTDLSPEMAEQMNAGMAAMMNKMEELCVTMCLVGLGSFIGASLQGSCFKIFAERQALKYRSLYFDAVLHQDVGWFDQKEIAALPSEINDDLEKIQDAFGDKFGNGIMSLSAFLGGFGCAFGMGWLIALVYAKAAAVVEESGVGAGMGYTMMIVFLGYALAFWFGMTLRYNDQINPATGAEWNPGTIMSIFFCIFIGSFMIGNLDPSLKANLLT